ncbi:MAG TPA: SufD family Fe-S cluster assembly protein [archaeon]|nr:SufD family Fe-S cluster assembly protein [archaeon]
MTQAQDWRKKILEKADKARDQPAKLGPDITIPEFEIKSSERNSISNPRELPKDVQQASNTVGINPDEKFRSGTYFQYDHSVVLARALKTVPGVEVMSTSEALEKYSWMKDYWWNAVQVDMDKYTATAELKQTHGYFIRTEPNTRLTLPVQACLFIGTQGTIQCPHNVIIAEKNSELHIITGCATHPNIDQGMHIGISEFYVKEGATITFTMIHGWAPNFEVRPRTGAIIERNGTFLNNYICFRPVKTLQMYPVAYCIGENSRARYHTLIYGSGDSYIDAGSRAFLRAKGARAEVTARVIAKDRVQIISRGHLVGEVAETKAHLDCRGLMLSSEARIHAIPELEGKVEGTDLSHEAAVGKIQEEQLNYLMARGLNADQATALIVRGFLDPEVPGLPDQLRTEVKRIVQLTAEKAL